MPISAKIKCPAAILQVHGVAHVDEDCGRWPFGPSEGLPRHLLGRALYRDAT